MRMTANQNPNAVQGKTMPRCGCHAGALGCLILIWCLSSSEAQQIEPGSCLVNTNTSRFACAMVPPDEVPVWPVQDCRSHGVSCAYRMAGNQQCTDVIASEAGLSTSQSYNASCVWAQQECHPPAIPGQAPICRDTGDIHPVIISECKRITGDACGTGSGGGEFAPPLDP